MFTEMSDRQLLESIKQDAQRLVIWSNNVSEDEFADTELLHYGSARVLDQIGLKCSELMERNPGIVSTFPEIEYWCQMDEHITRSPIQTPEYIANVVFSDVPTLVHRMDILSPDVL